jgi:hypothetical protein
MNLSTYREFVADTKATKKLLIQERLKYSASVELIRKNLSDLKELREIVSAVSIVAQETTKNIFESLVSQALKTVFGEEYSFELESRFSRNQPEMEMYVVENGVRYSPKDEKGGAIVDIVSFSSRIVSWVILEPKTQNTILLDEPFRCLYKDTLPLLAQLMQDISDELGIQFLYITHEKELSEVSCRPELDKSFLVTKIDGISRVERIV